MYKIIQNNKIIDAVEHPKFVRFLASGNIALTDSTSAHGIVGSDDITIYSFDAIAGKHYPVVLIEKLESVDEFRSLKKLLNHEHEIDQEVVELSEAKRSKIESLSNQCNNIITSGFSVLLSDKQTYNFRLTAEDQLNLVLIENRLESGDSQFVYHATNMPCKVYNKKDMAKIVKTFRQHMLYHTTYFNTAKQYIYSLNDIAKVESFNYGDYLAWFVEDPVLKQILSVGGSLK